MEEMYSGKHEPAELRPRTCIASECHHGKSDCPYDGICTVFSDFGGADHTFQGKRPKGYKHRLTPREAFLYVPPLCQFYMFVEREIVPEVEREGSDLECLARITSTEMKALGLMKLLGTSTCEKRTRTRKSNARKLA